MRRCDNLKRSLTNECFGAEETISAEEPSFPVLVASLFSDIFQGPLTGIPMCLCTEDVEAAYRRLACRDPEATVRLRQWQCGIQA